MPTTFTIKQVPDRVADGMRRRAATNRRSLQRELLLIIECAAAGQFAAADSIGAPPAPAYAAHGSLGTVGNVARKSAAGSRAHGKLNLEQLWERARALGPPMPGESADLIRRDRDARHGR